MCAKLWLRIFSSILLAGLLLSLTKPGVAQVSTPANNIAALANPDDPYTKIETILFTELAEKGQADFFITLKEKADLSPADQLTTKLQKGEFVFNTLRQTADRTQQSLRAYLDAQGATYTSFYIANTIMVRGGTQDLLMTVAARSEVASVTANHTYQLEPPKVEPVSLPQAPAWVQPNIAFVNADDVWAMGITGQGIVLGDNNTGIEWNHDLLKPFFRGWNGVTVDHNYSWYDATGMYPYEPVDVAGAGTLIAGIMAGGFAGDTDIGMAPGAKVIHCKSVDDEWSATDDTVLTCLEWDLAPWNLAGNNPRPDLAPDALNFSRTFEDGLWLKEAIDNLTAAGILVVTQANDDWSGTGSCSTVGSPGDYQEVLTVGSVYHGDGVLPGSLSSFSGRGPSLVDGSYAPDVLAPGEYIFGLGPGNWFNVLIGTGYAAPHATGMVALMWSANPALRGQVEDTIQIIQDTAVPLTGQGGPGCGGDYTNGPNNDWGYGTIDALAAVQAAIAYGGMSGTLQGTVTDAVSGDPIPGADIQATLSITQNFQTFTNQDGEYSLDVVAGTYTVDAQAFAYQLAEVTVAVGDGVTVTQDFPLVLLPTHVVSVTVVDAEAGWPLYAHIRLLGTPLDPAWNDPLTGHSEISAPEGTNFTLVVDAWTPGYLRKEVAVDPVMGDMSLVVQVEPDLASCTAPGYEFIVNSTVLTEEFELSDGGYTITGTNPSWEWGSPLYGPGSAHSGANVWATGLTPGIYNTWESSYLTSPFIDLSSQAGKYFHLSWWQWLQTELGDTVELQVSKDGGATWTKAYGPVSGDIDLSWANHIVGLDTAYAVSDFQLRFHVYSKWSVNKAGWYLDDFGLQAGECLPPTGGLVAGNVYDANNGLPVAGALVENDSGFSTLSAVTVDAAVDDAFYVLFSPQGSHTFTATLESYQPDVRSVEVISGSVVAQHFFLPAGYLTVDPLSLEATVELGSSTTQILTLTNDGGVEASYAISEIGSGFQPVLAKIANTTQMAGLDVFIASADEPNCEPITRELIAFGDLRSVTCFDARNDTPTLAQLLNYDVVLTWDAEGYMDSSQMGDVLADYVDAGGKVIDLLYAMNRGLRGRFEDENYTAFQGVTVFGTSDCLGEYDASHPIMAGITELCDWDRMVGTYLTPGSTAITRWTGGEILAAIKDNRSVVSLNYYVGFWSGWSGQGDVLVHSAILWLAGEDLPWLTEDPGSGTLDAEVGVQDVTITFDASVPEINQPGEYSARLKVRSDTPYAPTYLPVNMTVTAPETYGKLEGTVYTLGHCDAETPTILKWANVSVVSGSGMTWEVMTDVSGHYQVWMDAADSPVTVTVKAEANLPASITGIEVEAGGVVTTQDINLRSIQPCVSVDETVLDVNVPLGFAKTLGIEVSNDGAGASPLVIKDVEGTSFTGNPDPPVFGLVCVFKDTFSVIDSTIVTETLTANGIPYEVHTYDEISTLDFNQFRMILITSDPYQELTDAYATYLPKFESYVNQGGFIAFFANNWGNASINGQYMYAPLPGGMVFTGSDYEGFNDIVDPAHPVMAGVPNPFQGDWVGASTGYFTNLPIGAKVIASDQSHGRPTIVEYPIGEGMVIALTQCVESVWWYEPMHLIMVNTYRWGANYVPALHAAWLEEDILTGTLEADSSLPVELTITAMPTMTVGEVYTATLWVMSKDLTHSRIAVTVRLHVLAPTIYMPVIWKSNP